MLSYYGNTRKLISDTRNAAHPTIPIATATVGALVIVDLTRTVDSNQQPPVVDLARTVMNSNQQRPVVDLTSEEATNTTMSLSQSADLTSIDLSSPEQEAPGASTQAQKRRRESVYTVRKTVTFAGDLTSQNLTEPDFEVTTEYPYVHLSDSESEKEPSSSKKRKKN